ncbi:MAG: dihydrodipicolinate synthase family protein, partial [Chlamydiia bacterium]|nr:dihydrodipicolinate synthase family protein [Chlamydiia bacterium]
MKFGSFVAILTPFTRNQKIDTKALVKHILWQIEQGTEGIVCCGATGEGVLLSEAEKKRVAQICIETTQKKIPVIVATGMSSTQETVRLTEKMQRLGVDGCLVVTPCYVKAMPKGLVAHYREVAKVALPVIPYHNPARTAQRFSAEVFAEIGEIPGVVALKDS